MHYLAEFYLPAHNTDLADLAGRACATAGQAARAGARPRFVTAIHVPDDEICFLLYEAESPAAVTAAGARAGLIFDRIVEVATSNAKTAAGHVQ